MYIYLHSRRFDANASRHRPKGAEAEREQTTRNYRREGGTQELFLTLAPGPGGTGYTLAWALAGH